MFCHFWSHLVIVQFLVTGQWWFLKNCDYICHYSSGHPVGSFSLQDQNATLVPVSYAITPLVANFSDILTSDEDLHIFVPDDKDEESMQISIDMFTEIYKLRSKSRREYWMLDISYWLL